MMPKTDDRLGFLRIKRDATKNKLKDANTKFLEARARKNFLESDLSKIDSEIELLEQGQLCLGDYSPADELVI